MFLFSLMLHAVDGAAPGPLHNGGECPSPAVTKTFQSSTGVSFSWNAVSGATGYQVWYVRSGDNFTSQVFSTGATSINFSNLSAGTYRFYFATDCGEGGISEVIITDDLMMG